MITVVAEQTETGAPIFRAVSGDRVASGKTVGSAVDALTEQTSEHSSEDETLSSTVIWVQNFQPDRFFTASQRDRLSSLMAKWRAARDMGTSLPQIEQAELEALVETETNAMAERVQALLNTHK